MWLVPSRRWWDGFFLFMTKYFFKNNSLNLKVKTKKVRLNFINKSVRRRITIG